MAQARELASLIPGAELVPLPSRNHILCEQEPAWPAFRQAVARFLDAGTDDQRSEPEQAGRGGASPG